MNDKQNFNVELGRRIAKYRRFADLLQADLAKMLNISRSTISSWEKGHQTISAYNLKQIANAINVSVETLLRDLLESSDK